MTETKKFSASKEINQLNKMYIEGLLQLMAIDECVKVDELNFFKTAIRFDNGSTYLLQLVHVIGPKFDLTKTQTVSGTLEEPVHLDNKTEAVGKPE